MLITGTEGWEELQRNFAEFQAVMQDILELDVEFFAVSDRTVAAAAVAADLLRTLPLEHQGRTLGS
ncbi:hypothetical protein [Nodosilinea sp. P-1105]|uniref:hypothetical protein n=1 Tax=Nodosilinea sp. P-1105 TaxID=2546229 RepID=UPI00146C5687|nr:hypothetical protein [Nodosilinea sp. P-1105]NMF84979.1 hypothetical protein [Nodosilinea sp. P-1105]